MITRNVYSSISFDDYCDALKNISSCTLIISGLSTQTLSFYPMSRKLKTTTFNALLNENEKFNTIYDMTDQYHDVLCKKYFTDFVILHTVITGRSTVKLYLIRKKDVKDISVEGDKFSVTWFDDFNAHHRHSIEKYDKELIDFISKNNAFGRYDLLLPLIM